MKTMPLQTEPLGVLGSSQPLLATPTEWRQRSAASIATWLPAPAFVPGSRAVLRRPAKAAPSGSLWLTVPREPIVEKAFFAGLIGAATIGIGYGFMCLVNLVEHWASVNSIVGHMVP